MTGKLREDLARVQDAWNNGLIGFFVF